MRCRKWEVRISRWHSGDLGKKDEAALLRHLNACPRCRATEVRFREVERLLESCSEPVVPAFLNEKVVLRVREQMQQRTEGVFSGLLRFRFRFARHALILGLSTAGILLGVVVGSNLIQTFQSPEVARHFDLITAILPNGSGADSTFEFIWTDD